MTTSVQTPVQSAIHSFEDRYLTEFKPKRAFYERIGINRIRFWQIAGGRKVPDINEAKRLSEYFGANLF